MSELPIGFNHLEYCEHFGAAAEQFVEQARGMGPMLEVPSCPGWTIAELLRHTGMIHRWVDAMVSARSDERIDRKLIEPGLPDDERWLPGWLSAGAEKLVATLAEADPTDPMWSWGARQNVGWWSRRMLHETTIHRVDCELNPRASEIDPFIATDGIDERFENIPSSAKFSPLVDELTGDGGLGFSAIHSKMDGPANWLVTLDEEGFEVERTDDLRHDLSVVTVSGSPDHLLLLLYGRIASNYPNLTVDGHMTTLDWWLKNSALA